METSRFLKKLDHDRIVDAIAEAEQRSSGEIRVFIERGDLDDPMQAAREQFQKLGMAKTRERNGVLILVAPRAQKFAVIGDDGVHEKCGPVFWERLIKAMQSHFKAENFTDAIVHAIGCTGDLLARHFPHPQDDRNELPDRIEEG